eukprot:709663-Rhodomonas_salina.2
MTNDATKESSMEWTLQSGAVAWVSETIHEQDAIHLPSGLQAQKLTTESRRPPRRGKAMSVNLVMRKLDADESNVQTKSESSESERPPRGPTSAMLLESGDHSDICGHHVTLHAPLVTAKRTTSIPSASRVSESGPKEKTKDTTCSTCMPPSRHVAANSPAFGLRRVWKDRASHAAEIRSIRHISPLPDCQLNLDTHTS